MRSAPGIAAEATAPDTITIGTASPGGVYYPYGHGLAIMLTKYLGVPFTDQATQGTVQNVLLIEQRKAMMGMTTMGVALQGWNGTGWAKGTQYRSMRALFPMYDTPFQFAAPKRLNLTSISAFAEKRIGDGPKGAPAALIIPKSSRPSTSRPFSTTAPGKKSCARWPSANSMESRSP